MIKASILKYIVLIILLIPTVIYGQKGGGIGGTLQVIGETEVLVGEEYHYYLQGGIPTKWYCDDCEIVRYVYDPRTESQSVVVTWLYNPSPVVLDQTPNSISVAIADKQGVQLYVNVSCSVNDPVMPVSIAQNASYCTGKTTLTYTKPTTDDWEYYWQETLTGRTTDYGSATSFVVDRSQRYYLRARHKNGCWGNELIFIDAVVYPRPVVKAPTVELGCGAPKLQLNNVSSGGFTYYWQTAVDGTDQSRTDAEFTVIYEGTYYARAYHQATSCWTAASTGVYVSPSALTEAVPTDAEANLPVAVSSNESITGTVNNPVTDQSLPATMISADNMVSVYTPRTTTISSEDFTSLDGLPKEDVIVSTEYFDGLGRSQQLVQKAFSPQGKDVVRFKQYDQFGREVKSYLPYADQLQTNGSFKTDAPTKQYTFYQNQAGIAHSDWAFSQTDYEASPLHRVIASSAQGASWVGNNRKVQTETLVNDGTEAVRRWKVADNTLINVGSGVYVAGELLIQQVTDEHGVKAMNYTNKLGQVVLSKREIGENTFASTYFVYDDFGNLRYEFPPKAVELMAANGWQLDTEVEKFIFAYRYDTERRRIAKKEPSRKGEMKTVFDLMGRVVLSQTVNQFDQNEWTFIKYDVLDRIAYTGILTTTKPHEELMAEAANFKGYEVMTSSGNYTNTVFPILDHQAEIMTIYHYDNYEVIDLNVYGYQPVNRPDFTDPVREDVRVRGLATAIQTKVLGTTDWLWTVMHYDEKGRTVQVIEENHLGGKNVLTTQYEDFLGRVDKLHIHHTTTNESVEILRWYEYDHKDRVEAAYYQINNQTPELLAAFVYNELGEVITKKLGNDLQHIDYRYNIRGWLTHINELTLEATNPDAPKDLWGMELSYDRGFEHNQFNGNIAGIKWKSAGDGKERAYGFQYDKRNQLIQADYRDRKTATDQWTRDEGDFTVFGVAYDMNGNIQKMNRQGAIGKDAAGNWVFSAMDRLNYQYNGNRLIAVDDQVATEGVAGDFNDPNQLYCENSSVGDEYHYDKAGNLIADTNKGITNIRYNHLNLPVEVDHTIHYTYNSAGVKLKKQVYDQAGGLQEETDYIGTFIYKDQKLETIQHEEGRVLAVGNDQYRFEYHYKDHLGNLRLSFREEEAVYTVTMEPDTLIAQEEERNFEQVDETRLVGVNARTGVGVSQLHGNNASRTMGVATVLKTNKGDNITWSTLSYYSSSNFDASLSTIPNLGNAGEGGIEHGSGIFSQGGSGLSISPLFDQLTDNRPHAYARIVLVDEDGNELQEAHKLIQKQANRYSQISITLEAEFDGYAVVYIANESKMDVFFDDMELRHQRLIWQENNYYPFGMSMKPIDQEGMPNNRWTYNGKELEKRTDWFEYGQRDYDPQLGRFHKVDRFAEKYGSLTPYHYGANNPIKYIDINGDSLWISYNGSNYLFNNGKVYLNGSEFTGKRKGFLKKTFNALTKIGTTDEGTLLLSALEGSTNNFTIAHYSNNPNKKQNSFIPDDNKKAFAEQFKNDPNAAQSLEAFKKAGVDLSGGSGGTIYWNPSGEILPTTSGLKINAVTDLAHELFHGLDSDRGLLDERKYLHKELEKSEWQAVYRENLLRSQLGLPLRTHYITKADANGTIISGTGPKMISTDKKPILPFWYKH
ncbi:MAG: DUF6443 domain-containing protein [Flammeovirgaceae bacterium]